MNKISGAITSVLLLGTCAQVQGADTTAVQEQAAAPASTQVVERAKSLPAIPRNKNGFRAYYTRLNYTKEWEKPWRVGSFADVVICFAKSDIGFVFWRGANYIPNWVTENGVWYNNQFVERSSFGINETRGCVEPMSDKQCRYSQVRIIQDNDARKIIHWRYAPVDVEYRHPFVDPVTGWFDWVDEYYFIYPDAVGTREQTLYSTQINEFTDWQESIIVNQPGRSPEDNIESTAVSICNLKGETKNYFWPETSKKTTPDGLPEKSCIQVVNLKSRQKPFIVIPPDDGLKIQNFSGHGRNSIFCHWDHWPVSQDKSWGRKAKSNDKPSSSSLTYWKGWNPVTNTETSCTMVMLHGMTDQTAGQLVPVAKSWLHPAAVDVKSPGCSFNGYDKSQMAYRFSLSDPDKNGSVNFEVKAGQDTPLINPAFVINNWLDKAAKVEIKGSDQKIEEIRQGIEYGADGNTLVVWVRARITVPVQVSIIP